MVEQSFIGNVSISDFVVFIAVIALTFFLGSFLSAFLTRILKTKYKAHHLVYRIVPKIVMYSIYIYGFYYGLNNVISFDIVAFTTAFGILGIIIAFSAQQTLQNIVAGILIFMERPYKIGDVVEYSGRVCRVRDFSIRTTTLRSINGEIIVVPNSAFVIGSVINFTKGRYTRIAVPISISSDSDLSKAINTIYRVCEENEHVLPHVPKKTISFLSKLTEEPAVIQNLEPRVIVKNMEKAKVNLEVWLWIWDAWNKDIIVSELLQELKQEFDKNKVSFG